MCNKLVDSDRLSWVLPEMDEASDPSRFRKDPRDAFLRLKRASTLTRRQLAVAREVCAWREETAAARDVPRKWLMSDEVIVEACHRTPTSLPRLRRIRGLEKLSESDARGIIASVQRGLDCPPADFPAAIKRLKPSPEKDGALDLMSAVVRVVAEKTGIAPQVIASKEDLNELLSGSRDGRLAQGWRHVVAAATHSGEGPPSRASSASPSRTARSSFSDTSACPFLIVVPSLGYHGRNSARGYIGSIG